MQLGYINFSQEEKNNLYKVIQSIRDAFSNKMFPGMLTLHNRTKYFAVLPYLYYHAEKGHDYSVREVRQRILDLEIKLTRQLVEDWKKYVGAKHINAFDLDYRWGLVYSMIKEIKEELNNGK